MKFQCEDATIIILRKADMVQKLIYRKEEIGLGSIVLEKGVFGNMSVIGNSLVHEFIKI